MTRRMPARPARYRCTAAALCLCRATAGLASLSTLGAVAGCGGHAGGEPIEYAGTLAGETVRLTVRTFSDGRFDGVLSVRGEQWPVSGEVVAERYLGQLRGPDGVVELHGERERDLLVIQVAGRDGEPTLATLSRRAGGLAARGAPDRFVVVNGRRLSEQRLDELQSQRGLRIDDGRYWYDPVSGACGAEGGPTAAFIPPGLELGGPLAVDASGGGTDVYVNGREIHALDLAALQGVIGPVSRGRYLLDPHGVVSYEDGAAIVDLSKTANQFPVAAQTPMGEQRSRITLAGSAPTGNSRHVISHDASGAVRLASE